MTRMEFKQIRDVSDMRDGVDYLVLDAKYSEGTPGVKPEMVDLTTWSMAQFNDELGKLLLDDSSGHYCPPQDFSEFAVVCELPKRHSEILD